MKYILITTIKSKLSEGEVMRIADSRKDHFKIVPGLIRKFWVCDDENKLFHGILEFESKESLDRYLKTDFANSVSKAYQTVEPVKLQVLRVQKEQYS